VKAKTRQSTARGKGIWYPKISVAGFDFLFTEPFEEFGGESVDTRYGSGQIHRDTVGKVWEGWCTGEVVLVLGGRRRDDRSKERFCALF
jgi:hypothetical protein